MGCSNKRKQYQQIHWQMIKLHLVFADETSQNKANQQHKYPHSLSLLYICLYEAGAESTLYSAIEPNNFVYVSNLLQLKTHTALLLHIAP